MKRLPIFALLIATATTVHAGFADGNKLKERMYNSTGLANSRPGSSPYKAGYGDGYVGGVADTLNGVVWCPRPNVTAGQVFDIVLKYLEDNPQHLDRSADVLVSSALQAAFPCPQK